MLAAGRSLSLAVLVPVLAAYGCAADGDADDAGITADATTEAGVDAGSGLDDAGVDMGSDDAGSVDADAGPPDQGLDDIGSTDTLADSGMVDLGVADFGLSDLGESDIGMPDVGVDAGRVDAGPVPSASSWTWGPGQPIAPREQTRLPVWGGDRVYLPDEDLSFRPPTNGSMYWPEAAAERAIPIASGLPASGGVAAWTGSLYLLGGGGNVRLNFVSDALIGFDPVANQAINFGFPGSLEGGLFVPFNGRVFLYGGWCFNVPPPNSTCLLDGAIFDPTTNTWSPISTVGEPGPATTFDPPQVAVWTGSEILVWRGSGSPGGRYDPVSDVWNPITAPAFTVGASKAVWTGREMFVWSDSGSGLYNPTTDTWRSVPPYPGLLTVEDKVVVWAQSQVVVLGLSGGGHFDPTSGLWEPANPLNYVTGSFLGGAVWTGEDVLVFTLDEVFRYGPRQDGNPTCNGSGNTDLGARVLNPAPRRTVVADERLLAAVTNNFSLTALNWSLDGNVIATGADTTYDFSTVTPGAHILRFEAVDGFGNTTCVEQALDVGRAPTINFVSPRPLDVADPMITVEASCADDVAYRVILGGTRQSLAAGLPGAGSFSGSIDLSSEMGETVDLVWIAIDNLGFERSSAPRTVLIRSDSSWTRLAYINGELCDLQDNRALYLNDADTFIVVDLTTGTETAINTPTGTPHCAQSRLIGTGGTLVRSGSTVEFVDGGSSATWTAANVAVAGNYAASIINSGSPIELRDLSTLTVQQFGLNPHPPALAVNAAGDVVWQDTTGSLQRTSLGGTNQTLASVPVPPHLALPTMDSHVMWRRSHGGGQWSLEANRMGTTVTVTGPSAYSPPPIAGGGYETAGTWIAYDAPDISGVRQVFLLGSTGSPVLATGFSDATFLEGLADDGSLIYDRDGISFYRSAAGVVSSVGATGEIWRRSSNGFAVLQGRVIYDITP